MIGKGDTVKPVAKIEISMYPDGRVTVTGPIDQKMLCYGLLGVAHDQIKEFSEKNQSPILKLR